MTHMRFTVPSVVLIFALLGCDSARDGVTGPVAAHHSLATNQPRFVRFDAALYSKAQRSASVVAVKGATAYLQLRYLTGKKPDNDKDVFVDLEIGGSSLWKRPDGTLIKDGDTITISVEVDDKGYFAFKFHPAGLVFHPKARPKLRLWCFNPANGLNDDDGDDHANPGLNIWVREDDTSPWSTSADSWHKVQDGMLEGFTYLGGFTRFAMASN